MMACLMVANVAMLNHYYLDVTDALQNQVIIEEQGLDAQHFEFHTTVDFWGDYELPKTNGLHKSQIIKNSKNNQLLRVVEKVEVLSSEFQHLRNQISSSDDRVNRQIVVAANILTKQEKLLDRLLAEKQQDRYMSLTSPDFLVELLDSFSKNNSEESDFPTAVVN